MQKKPALKPGTENPSAAGFVLAFSFLFFYFILILFYSAA